MMAMATFDQWQSLVCGCHLQTAVVLGNLQAGRHGDSTDLTVIQHTLLVYPICVQSLPLVVGLSCWHWTTVYCDYL